MSIHRTRLAAAGIIATALLLAGCGSDEPEADTGNGADSDVTATEDTGSEPTEDDSDGETAEATITIRDFAFGEPLTVAPGTEVTVVNEDSAPHNANDAGGAWEFELLQQDESTTFTAPDEPGTYDLICTAHPQMSGELIVEG